MINDLSRMNVMNGYIPSPHVTGITAIYLY